MKPLIAAETIVLKMLNKTLITTDLKYNWNINTNENIWNTQLYYNKTRSNQGQHMGIPSAAPKKGIKNAAKSIIHNEHLKEKTKGLKYGKCEKTFNKISIQYIKLDSARRPPNMSPNGNLEIAISPRSYLNSLTR